MLALSRSGVLIAVCLAAATAPVLAQQRGSVSGKVLDPDGLVLPGVTITVTEQNTGFTRTVVTARTGAYTVPNLDPGLYTLTVEMPGFAPLKRTDFRLTAGSEVTLDFKMQVAGVQETLTVTGAAPLVERTSNRIGGSLSSKEIEDVPSNFRNFTALTQLIPGMTPNPAQSTFEGGQVVANGTPSQSNLYLLDGMYNNDDRLGGSQGTQVRVVLDNIEEYQVLANQYSAEYGGGAGAIINMVTVGGINRFSGRAYNYYRSDKFNATNYFVKQAGSAKPHELTFQTGAALGGPIVKDRAFFYATIERDAEDQAGLKKFPAAAAPLVKDFVGEFNVRVMNYFGRGDLRINDKNFISARWILEMAPTKGEGFNTNNAAPDARSWESDWDQLFGFTHTGVLSDRASNVVRIARIGEQLGTGQQTFFDEVKSDPLLLGQGNVEWVGFDGRDPLTLGQQNNHPSYLTGKGGDGQNTRIRSYLIDDSFSYFVPSLLGGEHTFKFGGGASVNSSVPRVQASSGVFLFRTDAPYNPAVPATYPYQFNITAIGPPTEEYGFSIFSRDRRYNFFVEDKWRVSSKLTFNAGLRYDYQRHTPASKRNFAPRTGFVWDVTGEGTTVVRGGVGRFYAYMPVSIDLAHQQTGVRTLYPSLSITAANDPGCAVLCPDMIADSAGNLGVATLSAAGIAYLKSQRDATLAGAVYNTNPRMDDPNRKSPYQDSWNLGFSQELGGNAAMTIDYVANRSRDQVGIIDINEPNASGVRPGPAGFDPTGVLIPAEARGVAFARVLMTTTIPEFDGDYQSLQVSFIKRMANRWSGRLAYTVQKSHYTGLGNPDARRVWLDNEPLADFGRFAGDRRQVLAMSGSVNPWRTLSINTVISAITGSPINETVGSDVNRDGDNNDRPIKGINDLTIPIRSAVDSQGRAVINGMQGPGSFLIDMSFRYQIPIKGVLQSLDLFFDMFNIANRVNYQAPTGNRASGNFMLLRGAQFPRQSQFGVRVRF